MFLLLVHSSEREGTGSVHTMEVGWEVVPYARSLSGVSKPGTPSSVC